MTVCFQVSRSHLLSFLTREKPCPCAYRAYALNPSPEHRCPLSPECSPYHLTSNKSLAQTSNSTCTTPMLLSITPQLLQRQSFTHTVCVASASLSWQITHARFYLSVSCHSYLIVRKTCEGSGHFGDDQRKDRKRRELAGRLSREMADKKETYVPLLPRPGALC